MLVFLRAYCQPLHTGACPFNGVFVSVVGMTPLLCLNLCLEQLIYADWMRAGKRAMSL